MPSRKPVIALENPSVEWGVWNPDADLNNDGLIDIVDLVIIGINFGKTW